MIDLVICSCKLDEQETSPKLRVFWLFVSHIASSVYFRSVIAVPALCKRDGLHPEPVARFRRRTAVRSRKEHQPQYQDDSFYECRFQARMD